MFLQSSLSVATFELILRIILTPQIGLRLGVVPNSTSLPHFLTFFFFFFIKLSSDSSSSDRRYFGSGSGGSVSLTSTATHPAHKTDCHPQVPLGKLPTSLITTSSWYQCRSPSAAGRAMTMPRYISCIPPPRKLLSRTFSTLRTSPPFADVPSKRDTFTYETLTQSSLRREDSP
jgi:hypothetical protein